MANYSIIKNTKKIKAEDLSKLMENELFKKYKLPAVGTFNKKDSTLQIKIYGLILPIFLRKNEIHFYDVSSTALILWNQNHEYARIGLRNGLFYSGQSCTYSFIYEYLKNFLAFYMKTSIESDGAGALKPWSDGKEVFKDFSTWLNLCAVNRKQDKMILKFAPTKSKIKKVEKTFFPTL